jgi:hypothetical protein
MKILLPLLAALLCFPAFVRAADEAVDPCKVLVGGCATSSPI